MAARFWTAATQRSGVAALDLRSRWFARYGEVWRRGEAKAVTSPTPSQQSKTLARGSSAPNPHGGYRIFETGLSFQLAVNRRSTSSFEPRTVSYRTLFNKYRSIPALRCARFQTTRAWLSTVARDWFPCAVGLVAGFGGVTKCRIIFSSA